MGAADLKQYEKTRKFICAGYLNCCLVSALYDDKNVFVEPEGRCYEWQLWNDQVQRVCPHCSTAEDPTVKALLSMCRCGDYFLQETLRLKTVPKRSSNS